MKGFQREHAKGVREGTWHLGLDIPCHVTSCCNASHKGRGAQGYAKGAHEGVSMGEQRGGGAPVTWHPRMYPLLPFGLLPVDLAFHFF